MGKKTFMIGDQRIYQKFEDKEISMQLEDESSVLIVVRTAKELINQLKEKVQGVQALFCHNNIERLVAIQRNRYHGTVCHNALNLMDEMRERGLQLPSVRILISGGPSPERWEYYFRYFINYVDFERPFNKYVETKNLSELVKRLSEWAKKAQIRSKFLEMQRLQMEIIQPFLPLHIGLQAFFNISLNETRNEFVKIDSERNKDAFLLFDEDEEPEIYDFYECVFNRLANPDDDFWNSDRPRTDKTEAPILRLIDNFCDIGKCESSQKEELKKFIRDRNLLKLCALLANTENCNDDYSNTRTHCLDELRQELGADSLEKHSKWPKDGNYHILAEQLNNFGREKAKALIKNIHEFANKLQTIIDQYQE